MPHALVLVVLLAVGCTGGDDAAGGNEATTTTEVRRSTADDVPLRVGQCGHVPRIRVGGPVDPAAIDIVPCDEPHDVEVVLVADHPAGPSIDFPGETAVDDYAVDRCTTEFEAYVGVPYEASVLDVAYVAPGEDGWDGGDRRIACVVYHLDLEPLTGSVRGSGR